MSGLATLVRHSLRRSRGFFAIAAVVLFVFQIFMILAARELQKSGGFQQLGNLLPQFLEQWTNMMAASFQGFVLFGYSHPVVELFLVAMAITIGTETTAEIESKFVDVILSRPIHRNAPVNRTIVMLILATAGAMVSMLIGTSVGLRFLAPPGAPLPETRVVLSLAFNLALLVLAWGGIALAIASWSKRRATAAGACGIIAFAAFILDYVGRFWEAVKNASRLSPFHYFSPFAIIGGQPVPRHDIAALLLIFVASAIVANAVYGRRDL